MAKHFNKRGEFVTEYDDSDFPIINTLCCLRYDGMAVRSFTYVNKRPAWHLVHRVLLDAGPRDLVDHDVEVRLL